jgi:hypothetical protein
METIKEMIEVLKAALYLVKLIAKAIQIVKKYR